MHVRSKIRLASVVCALLSVSTAESAVIKFVFTGEMGAVNALSDLIQPGDRLTIEVFADNGSSSLLSQRWQVSDTTYAILSAGSYSATFTDNWFTSSLSTGFLTDDTGNLIETNWLGARRLGSTGVDNFGVGAALYNESFEASGSSISSFRIAGYGPNLRTVSAWSNPVSAVPEPGLFTVLLLSLIGCATTYMRKSRVKQSQAE